MPSLPLWQPVLISSDILTTQPQVTDASTVTTEALITRDLQIFDLQRVSFQNSLQSAQSERVLSEQMALGSGLIFRSK
jgi:hypothetical protein